MRALISSIVLVLAGCQGTPEPQSEAGLTPERELRPWVQATSVGVFPPTVLLAYPASPTALEQQRVEQLFQQWVSVFEEEGVEDWRIAALPAGAVPEAVDETGLAHGAWGSWVDGTTADPEAALDSWLSTPAADAEAVPLLDDLADWADDPEDSVIRGGVLWVFVVTEREDTSVTPIGVVGNALESTRAYDATVVTFAVPPEQEQSAPLWALRDQVGGFSLDVRSDLAFALGSHALVGDLQVQDQVELEYAAVPGSIEVYRGTLPMDLADWQYDPATNAVTFDNLEPGTTNVEVRYLVPSYVRLPL